MIKTVAISLLALAFTLPAVAPAQGFGIKRFIQIPVLPIDANTFETVVNDGAGGSDMWCAAGIFTRDYLKQRGGKLFIKREVGPSETFPGRKSVIFTTQPVPNAFNNYTESVSKPGKEFSQGHAYSICPTIHFDEYRVSVRVISRSGT